MSVNACVYCDCFEKGRPKSVPPEGTEITLCPDGSLDFRSEDLPLELEFDQWLLDRACEHWNGVMIYRDIGNIAMVATLYEEIAKHSESFPLILNKVLYSGTHCGDFLTPSDVEILCTELEILAEIRCGDDRRQGFLDEFRRSMTALADVALQIKKPIVF